MPELGDVMSEAVERAGESRLNSIIALLVALAATFVALKLDPLASADAGLDSTMGWTAWAVGDACLFHVRRGSLLTCFPMGASTDFDLHPFLYQSKPLRSTPLAVVMRGERARAGELDGAVLTHEDATRTRR